MHGRATTIPQDCPLVLPSNTHMLGTPTAATMRLDGGHPALELVNTIYAVLGGPVDFDVLATPGDLVTLARRGGGGGEATGASAAGLQAAHALRASLDPLLRAHLVMDRGDAAARAALPTRVATSWGAADVAPAVAAFE